MGDADSLREHRFSVAPHEPMTIVFGDESFDLHLAAAFKQWHGGSPKTDFYGIRVASGALLDLRVVTETPPHELYATRSGFYTVKEISKEDAEQLDMIWQGGK